MDVDVETDVANGRLLAYLAKNAEILSRTYTDDRVSIHCRVPRKFLGRIRPEEAVIRPRCTPALHNGNGNGNGNDKRLDPLERPRDITMATATATRARHAAADAESVHHPC